MPQRNNDIDIAKGLLIVAMVLGHTGFVGTRFIYLFHIPCFVFLSGYLHTSNFSFQFVRRRFIGLYRPFVEYSIIYLFSINLFIELDILDVAFVSIDNLAGYGADIFLMKGLGGYLGAFWYLTMILEVIAVYLFLDRFLQNMFHLTLFVAVLFIFSYLFIARGVDLPAYLDITSLMLGAYHLGRLYKLYENRIPNNVYILISSVLVLVLLYWNSIEINIGSKILPNIFLFLLAFGSGICFIMSFSKVIRSSFFADSIVYIGRRTIPILALHFFSFKIVDLVLFHLFKIIPTMGLSQFPNTYGNSTLFICIYLSAGISLPLLMVRLRKLLSS
jgi:fucose 4-O-acetylase-like acetyltransferase